MKKSIFKLFVFMVINAIRKVKKLKRLKKSDKYNNMRADKNGLFDIKAGEDDY